MRYIFLLLVTGFLIASCGSSDSSKEKNESSTSLADSSAKEPLYPYPQYIQSQLEYVDSTPLAIEMLVYENHQLIDSGYISRDSLKILAKEFSEPDLNMHSLRPLYDEKSYQDLTINRVTFSITAKKPELEVQQVDILLDPVTKKVKNIIMKKQATTKDAVVIKNLMWVHNMNFQVSSTIEKNDGTTTDRLVKVIWDRPLK